MCQGRVIHTLVTFELKKWNIPVYVNFQTGVDMRHLQWRLLATIGTQEYTLLSDIIGSELSLKLANFFKQSDLVKMFIFENPTDLEENIHNQGKTTH